GDCPWQSRQRYCPGLRRPLHEQELSYAETAQPFIELCEAEDFWIAFRSSPPQLGKLFVAQTVSTSILSLDAHEDFSCVLLALGWPSQHAIENLFHLFLCHGTKITRPTLRCTAVRQLNEPPSIVVVGERTVSLRSTHLTVVDSAAPK